MLFAPQTSQMLISAPSSVIKTFIRVRDVRDGVICLHLGGKRGYEYRSVISINTVNFALMSDEDKEALIEGFKEFLNGLSFPIQILIRNTSHKLDTYLERVESVQGDLAELAQDHAKFVREFASKRALVKRSFYVIVAADHDPGKKKDEGFLNAQTQLKLRVDELRRQLERLGLTAQRLDTDEIIHLYQNCFSPQDAYEKPLTEGLIKGANRLLTSTFEDAKRDPAKLLALPEPAPQIEEPLDDEDLEEDPKQKKKKPKDKKAQEKQAKKEQKQKEKLRSAFGNIAEVLAPSSIQIFPWYMRIDGEMGHEYVQALNMVSYPRSAYPGWLDSIVQINEPNVDYSIHIVPMDSQKVNSHLSRKATEFRGNVLVSQRQGKSTDPTANIALQDIETLRENLARGDEHVFNMSIVALVRGRSRRELKERSNRVMSAIRSLDFRALPTHWQHHAGFLSCLPEADNVIGRGRVMGTGAASTFYPFTGGDISMDTGVMFGVAPTGGPVIINPFDNTQIENANMVVFAKSGGGKSFFFKTVSSRLLATCNVYVIDPEAEYSTMCNYVNGQYVRLSSESLQFNPLDLYGQRASPEAEEEVDSDEGNFFREKLLNLVTLLELVLSDEGTLTQREKAFLYKCLRATYENRGININPITHTRPAPNMHELYLIMSSASRGDNRFGVGEDTFGLSERLERYLHLFPKKTAITLENRFIDFNIRELGDSLKPVGLFLIAEFLWTKMRQARQARVAQPNTIILIDEAWLLMQFPEGATFLAEFARRIRKYGGGLWCTTQNSDDFLNSEKGRTILAMSTMKFLMKQDTSTINSVVETFRLSPGQRNFLLAARRGEGLFATKSWTSMEVVASPKEKEMANTTLQAYSLANAATRVEVLEDLNDLAELIQGQNDSEQPMLAQFSETHDPNGNGHNGNGQRDTTKHSRSQN